MKYEPMRVIVNRLFGAIPDAEHRIVDFSLRELYAFVINNVDKLKEDFLAAIVAMGGAARKLPTVSEKTFRIPHEWVCVYDGRVANQKLSVKNVYKSYPMSWGCYSILVDEANERGCPPGIAIRKAFGWALVMMLPFCVWGATEAGYCALDGSFSVTLDGAANAERFSNALTWLNLGFLGLLASAACFVMWNCACREIGVVRTTVGLYLTPIVGVVFAAVFLGERLTRMSLLGGGFVVVGVAIANWRWRR